MMCTGSCARINARGVGGQGKDGTQLISKLAGELGRLPCAIELTANRVQSFNRDAEEGHTPAENVTEPFGTAEKKGHGPQPLQSVGTGIASTPQEDG